jgi:TrmH family RNA methyltransferase
MKATVAQEHFQYLKELQQNRVKRNQAKEFVVEGVRAINQARQHRWPLIALVYAREAPLSAWAAGVIASVPAPARWELPLSLMERLSQKEEPSELLALAAMPPDDLARLPVREELLVVVFDRPASPGNLGTLIRSCDALGADGLIITGHAVDLYDPETLRATAGSFFSVPVVRLPSQKELEPWVAALRRTLPPLQVVGSSAKATATLAEHDLRGPTILLVGNETHGLSAAYRAWCDAMVTIPMSGSATSLNVACATSILLYEVARQRRERGA